MKKLLLVIPLLIMGLFACKKDSSSSGGGYSSSTNAKVTMHLTDGPATYDAVYLNVQEVQVNVSNGSWISMTPVRPGLYNILNFRNGLDTMLGWVEIPAGTISQMRLILGDGNYVVVNGVDYPLTTPSAQESGLKLNINQTLVAGNSYDFWIDFDAARSIHQTGNGKYMLKPVMRAYSELTDGRIKGYALPPAAGITVYAINGTDTLSAIPNVDGYFGFNGLSQGTYELMFNPADTTYQSVVMPNVQVTFGTITDVGTVTLVH
ncbi:DUF4382 domain-containing protein [Taibaiella soli]|uniref:DUF4382 domain-containing protein n=1 Tax=Taibaiella soli TaxID=1649169 RepID=A0A2W2B4C5_9BACT|nr:DUF4382 domain-containing protein [Taibaiella soli]PZF74908.1 hypothetical protein DN068_01550 [Taibaiella soli]